ncbi:MAG: phospholipase D-like domain-containing protein, partial [Elusimicrobiales bacterium]
YCCDISTLLMAENVKILHRSDLFVREIFEMIESSKDLLLLEFYEIADDNLGKKIQDALISKRQQGVSVKIIYDSIGSKNTSKDFWKRFKQNGIEVIEYNPIRFFTSLRKWFRRDHRKIIVSDFSKALVGGFNLSLDYAPLEIGGRNWKDMGISFCGEVVGHLCEIFRDNWVRCGGNYFEINKAKGGNILVSIAYDFGIASIHSVRRAYRYAMDNAKDFIYITNAYFLPDKTLSRCLKRAVMRGVDVRIIVPHKTDHPYVRLASFMVLKDLIKHGVKVYEWMGEVLHAKSAVVDGVWISLGSHNLDHISLHYNLELNLNIYDEKIGLEMKEIFENDLLNSKEITLSDIKNMPISFKAMSYLIYFFRDFL